MTIIDRESPNVTPRAAKTIEVIVIHSTEGTMPGCLEWLLNPASGASCHYLIDRQGVTYRLVSENMKAWHAGKSQWRGRTDVNQFSIGIELEDAHAHDTVAFTGEQYVALAQLVTDIRSRHGPIPCVGHADISPGRRSDPGPLFDWSRVPQPEPTLRQLRWQAPVRALIHGDDETLAAFLERMISG